MHKAFIKLPERKQRKILNAAAKVFADKGFYQANVADICKTAGISNGALYTYFKNKETLFMAVFENGVHELEINLFSKHLSPPGPFYEKLHNLLKGLEHYGHKDRREIALYYELGSKAMNKFASTLSDKIEVMARKYYIEMIIEGKQNNHISNSVHNEMAAYIIDNNVNAFAFSLYSDHYEKRFSSYFSTDSRRLTCDEKIQVLIALIKKVLS